MQLNQTVNPYRDPGDGVDRIEADVRANRYDVLSRVADDLAHEIKNPLNAIVVNLEVLRRRVANGAADAALDRAAVIEHEVRRVHQLIEQLLQLLRPAKRESAAVAVDGLLEALTPVLQVQARAVRVALTCRAGSNLYAQVRSESLKFALLNLVVHALDAEARGGSAVVVEAKRSDPDVCVTVTCATAVLRSDDEPIAICRQLMSSAGGSLATVEPTVGGVGSTATLVMPPGNFA